MKLLAQKAERTLLMAMMERKRILQKAFPRLTTDLFGVTEHVEIFERMIALMQNGKAIPSVRVMAQDPGLSKEAQVTLAIAGRERVELQKFSVEDLDHSLETLKYFCQTRILYEMDKWVAEQLSNRARTSIQKIKAHIQESITELDGYDKSGGSRIFGIDGNISDRYIKANLQGATGDILPTGIPSIDNKIKGWRKGNLVLLTAMR